jgi:hypothetical protein
MRWKPHVRFGERAGETDQLRGWHRAPARLHLQAPISDSFSLVQVPDQTSDSKPSRSLASSKSAIEVGRPLAFVGVGATPQTRRRSSRRSMRTAGEDI